MNNHYPGQGAEQVALLAKREVSSQAVGSTLTLLPPTSLPGVETMRSIKLVASYSL